MTVDISSILIVKDLNGFILQNALFRVFKDAYSKKQCKITHFIQQNGHKIEIKTASPEMKSLTRCFWTIDVAETRTHC